MDAGADSPSAIRQAFVAALQRELASHYFLLSRLDALAMRPLPTGACYVIARPPLSSTGNLYEAKHLTEIVSKMLLRGSLIYAMISL